MKILIHSRNDRGVFVYSIPGQPPVPAFGSQGGFHTRFRDYDQDGSTHAALVQQHGPCYYLKLPSEEGLSLEV